MYRLTMIEIMDSIVGKMKQKTKKSQGFLQQQRRSCRHSLTSMRACVSRSTPTLRHQQHLNHLLASKHSLRHPPQSHQIRRSMATHVLASSGGYITKQGKQADEARGPDLVPGLAKTLWGQHCLAPRYPRLEASTSADVCVVGGGLAGLSVAYELARNGVSVVVLESRVIAGGQTGRDPGHVTRWNNDWYSQLSSLFNRNTITTVARSQMQAVDWVRDTIQRERIDCHWQEVPTVLFANTDGDEHLRRLRAEREACRVVGWHDVMQEAWGFVAPQHLGGGRGDKAGGVGEDNHGRAGTAVPVNQCLVFPNGSGQLDPIKFAHGLAAAIVRHGGRIYERTRVVNYHYSNAQVDTDDNHRVTAQHVVLATNVPINRDLTFHTGRITARKKYIAALTIPRDSMPLGLYYTTEPTYHSMRVVAGENGGPGTGAAMASANEGPSTITTNTAAPVGGASTTSQHTATDTTPTPTPTTGQHDILLVTGEHHASGQFVRHYKDYIAAVEGWARGRVGNVGQLVGGWSVQSIEPVDKLGLYGSSVLAVKGNVWVATGDSGQAVTGGALAAMILGGSILGRPPPFASVYAPSRVPPLLHGQVVSHWAQEAVNVGVNYAEAALPKGPGDIEDLAPGKGCVVQRGLKKVAAYRDEHGALHTFSAICPHMYCTVRWNPVDTTFDCSCHGSQFDCYGRVFQGPSTGDLEPINTHDHNTQA